MKTRLWVLTAGVGLALGVASANAITYKYRDFDPIGKTIDAGNPLKTTLEGQFDIATNSDGTEIPEKDKVGYDPVTQTITEASAWFKFRNARAEDDIVSVLLNGASFAGGPVSVPFSKFGGAITGSLWVDLDQTGQLDYKIIAEQGKFKVVWARLDAVAEERRVPDNGLTLSLLGLALCSLRLLRGSLTAA
ncbi:MAG: hypothetical protein HYY24_26605 [Verrucomicrobia bacterium]|nr:hypothetical protein [Verrucomicrobiota bacterium]